MIDKPSFSWDLFDKAPIVGIIRGMDKALIFQLAKSFLDAELYTLEITMNTKSATRIIAELRSQFPALNIGAGTVCTLAELEQALDAGAQFIVMPITEEEVIKKAVAENIPIFPGAYTPTEIYKAWSLGASAVKVFPANQLGPKYIKNVLAPLNHIKLLPTGGVSIENINAFFEAGAVGVGMGSSLFNKKYIQEKDFEGLKNHFKQLKKEIKDFTK